MEAVPVRSLRPQIRPEPQPVTLTSTNSGFNRWVAGFRGRALSQGISAAVFDRAFRGARYNPDIVARIATSRNSGARSGIISTAPCRPRGSRTDRPRCAAMAAP